VPVVAKRICDTERRKLGRDVRKVENFEITFENGYGRKRPDMEKDRIPDMRGSRTKSP
jgi:hypothetical protein